jgi:hypothetical protein
MIVGANIVDPVFNTGEGKIGDVSRSAYSAGGLSFLSFSLFGFPKGLVVISRSHLLEQEVRFSLEIVEDFRVALWVPVPPGITAIEVYINKAALILGAAGDSNQIRVGEHGNIGVLNILFLESSLGEAGGCPEFVQKPVLTLSISIGTNATGINV